MKESYLSFLIKNDMTNEALEYISKLTTNQLNFESEDDTGKTALHWAVLKKNVIVTKKLTLKLSDWALNIIDHEGNTAANYASLLGHKSLIEAVCDTKLSYYEDDYSSMDL